MTQLKREPTSFPSKELFKYLVPAYPSNCVSPPTYCMYILYSVFTANKCIYLSLSACQLSMLGSPISFEALIYIDEVFIISID